MRVLHLSPHPDDELLGAPATLMALADAGHEIVNVAVSLGRPEQAERRERELREASARAGFALRVCSPPIDIREGDLTAAQARLTDALVRIQSEQAAGLLIAPSPHDGHHGHELVGRCAVAAATALRVPLWLWGLWSDLPLPTILHPFAQPLMDRVVHALSAYAVELERNDYGRLVTSRAQASAIAGPERVFGFGSAGVREPYAELLCEAVPKAGRLLLGTARVLDAASPPAKPTSTDITAWLRSPSVRASLRR